MTTIHQIHQPFLVSFFDFPIIHSSIEKIKNKNFFSFFYFLTLFFEIPIYLLHAASFLFIAAASYECCKIMKMPPPQICATIDALYSSGPSAIAIRVVYAAQAIGSTASLALLTFLFLHLSTKQRTLPLNARLLMANLTVAFLLANVGQLVIYLCVFYSDFFSFTSLSLFKGHYFLCSTIYTCKYSVHQNPGATGYSSPGWIVTVGFSPCSLKKK